MIVQYEIIEREAFLLPQGAHPRDAMLLLLSGAFSLKIHGESASLRRGDAAFFSAGVPFERLVTEPMRALYVQFQKMPKTCKRAVYFGSERTRAVLDALEKAAEGRTLSEDMLMHFIEDIFYADALLFSEEKSGRMHEVKRALEASVNKEISLSSLARQFGYTEQGLILAFKRVYHISPMALLLRLRIECAERLLLAAEPMPLSLIAEACGYASLYYFSNAFKKAKGISPSEFRKMHRI